ncbi:MAG: Clp protease N-terminal domain-containing protein [Candidatus Paceibacterota bacterium]
MFDQSKLTPGLEECLMLAYIEAKLERRKELSTEQVLLMLLENTQVVTILNKFNINIRTLRAGLTNHINANEPILDGDNEVNPEASTSMTRICRHTLTLRFFKSAEKEPISESDFILSLVTDDTTVASQLLATQGMDLDKLLYELVLGSDNKRF